MKAVINGTPMQIEGEPAEIAALVELLSSGAVFVEHLHRWRIDAQADENGTYQARCWCGQEKTMQPWGDNTLTSGRWKKTGNADLGLGAKTEPRIARREHRRGEGEARHAGARAAAVLRLARSAAQERVCGRMTTRRLRAIFATCPACAIVIVSPDTPSRMDVGVILAGHIDAAHPALLYGSAEAERRRMAADAHGRRN